MDLTTRRGTDTTAAFARATDSPDAPPPPSFPAGSLAVIWLEEDLHRSWGFTRWREMNSTVISSRKCMNQWCGYHQICRKVEALEDKEPHTL